MKDYNQDQWVPLEVIGLLAIAVGFALLLA